MQGIYNFCSKLILKEIITGKNLFLVRTDHFQKHLVTYEEFVKDPSVLVNPKLVIRIQNKFFNWQMAGPLIVSQLAFQRPLPDVSIDG